MGVEQIQWLCRISSILLVDSQESRVYKTYVFGGITVVIACFGNNMESLSLGNSYLPNSLPSPYSKITHKTIIEVSIVYSVKAEKKTDFKIHPKQAGEKNAKKKKKKKRIIFHP